DPAARCPHLDPGHGPLPEPGLSPRRRAARAPLRQWRLAQRGPSEPELSYGRLDHAERRPPRASGFHRRDRRSGHPPLHSRLCPRRAVIRRAVRIYRALLGRAVRLRHLGRASRAEHAPWRGSRHRRRPVHAPLGMTCSKVWARTVDAAFRALGRTALSRESEARAWADRKTDAARPARGFAIEGPWRWRAP